MTLLSTMPLWRLSIAGQALLLLCACNVLRPTATPQPSFFSLDSPQFALPPAALPGAPTLIVNLPRAAAGFDSPRIIYLRKPHELEYFAHSEWVEPPSRMLTPLIVAAIENSGAFHAVLSASGIAAGNFRLETEIVRLQQEFLISPSIVRFTLRAYLIEDKSRRVLAWREFDTTVPSASDDPHGGVVAANAAVHTVLTALAAFCVEEVRNARSEK